MEFTNTFSVQAGLPQVWEFMLNAQEVAPCVPGAQITETVDDRHYKGTVKIKLGAVQMTYRGELEMDPDVGSRTITLRAKGTEQRGSGGASGTVTTKLTETPEGQTHVEIVSRIDVTGRVAQFGRGIMQDVSNRLIRDFARCLEQKLQNQSGSQESESDSTSAPRAPGGDESGAATAAAEPTPVQPPPPQPSFTQPVPRPNFAPSERAYTPPGELKMHSLVFDILRSRVAVALRGLAKLIDPN